MKRILPVALFGLLASTLILAYLKILNNKAGADIPARTFTAYNHSNQPNADSILSFWRAINVSPNPNPIRVDAVKQLIMLDYVLMVVYCFSLCFILIQLRKRKKEENRRVIKNIFTFGIIAVLIGTAIDAIQDTTIYSIVADNGDAKDMRFYTYSKFILIGLGGLSMLAFFVPKEGITCVYLKRIGLIALRKSRSYLSQLLKCIWVFFPGILFLLLAIAAFWLAGQGKDIMVAFTNNDSGTVNSGNIHWSYSIIVFFLAISFWAYVSWYSSRIIFYIKLKKQREPVKEIENETHTHVNNEGISYPNITEIFMVEFPRLIGNACFLVLELAFLQSPMMIYAIDSGSAWILFAELLLIFYFLNKWVKEKLAGQAFFRPLFNWLGIGLVIVLIVLSFLPGLYFATILLVLIMLLHIIYILYTNLHRLDVAKGYTSPKPPQGFQKLLQKIMCVFNVPPGETGYFKWFVYMCLLGVVMYFLGINILPVSRKMGPFPFILLAFAVLLAFGNVITAFSVKYKVNFHFIIFLLAFVVGSTETHDVRLQANCTTKEKMRRPNLKTYLTRWLEKNGQGSDSIDMYFIMSNGGASRSGYWTASVLGRIEDATFLSSKKFSDQIFCLSGTSGGGVGVAAYFASLNLRDTARRQNYEKSLSAYLKKDYFTFTFARLLGPDYFHYIIPRINLDDRAGKLEESFEESTETADTLYEIPFDKNFSNFTALTLNDDSINYPLLFLNTTRVQDGNPGIVTNLRIDSSAKFNNRVDVIDLVPKTKNITMATASILGARFPYLSPAGRLGTSDFVDGGYFDNSGAGVVQELIRSIIILGKPDSINNNDFLVNQVKRIRFHVLHIVNSPIISEPDSVGIKPITPIENDLLAPVLTIIGAYGMQTTVNDRRLINYLKDLKNYSKTETDYARISLYKNKDEWKEDTLAKIYTSEPPYAMNWFMSDTTKRRIDKRLHEIDSLKKVIDLIKLRHP